MIGCGAEDFRGVTKTQPRHCTSRFAVTARSGFRNVILQIGTLKSVSRPLRIGPPFPRDRSGSFTAIAVLQAELWIGGII
jgi:hypothetical protein